MAIQHLNNILKAGSLFINFLLGRISFTKILDNSFFGFSVEF